MLIFIGVSLGNFGKLVSELLVKRIFTFLNNLKFLGFLWKAIVVDGKGFLREKLGFRNMVLEVKEYGRDWSLCAEVLGVL